jgi:hypothetical protein
MRALRDALPVRNKPSRDGVVCGDVFRAVSDAVLPFLGDHASPFAMMLMSFIAFPAVEPLWSKAMARSVSHAHGDSSVPAATGATQVDACDSRAALPSLRREALLHGRSPVDSQPGPAIAGVRSVKVHPACCIQGAVERPKLAMRQDRSHACPAQHPPLVEPAIAVVAERGSIESTDVHPQNDGSVLSIGTSLEADSDCDTCRGDFSETV